MVDPQNPNAWWIWLLITIGVSIILSIVITFINLAIMGAFSKKKNILPTNTVIV